MKRKSPKTSPRALIELAKIPTERARQPLVEQLRQGIMSTEDIRTIVQEVLSLLKTPLLILHSLFMPIYVKPY